MLFISMSFMYCKICFDIKFGTIGLSRFQISINVKGQKKLKADWRAVDSPKKRTNEFFLFAFLLFTANKTNSFVHFLGESTARPNCFRFYLTFKVVLCDRSHDLSQAETKMVFGKVYQSNKMTTI